MHDPDEICWRLHLGSPPEKVYEFLTTAEGRSAFWAESANEEDGVIRFVFANGQSLESRILERRPPCFFSLAYFGGSQVSFELVAADDGTDLTLKEVNVPANERDANQAGWVAVLLHLKAAVDFGVDLRNHDAERTWEAGYVDI